MTAYRVTLNGNDFPNNQITVDCDDLRFDSDNNVTFIKGKTLVAYVPDCNVRTIERVAKKCSGC